MINGNGSRSSSNAASNSKWSKCSRSTLNSHKRYKSASSEKYKDSRIRNRRAAALRSTRDNNKPRRPDHAVRPSQNRQVILFPIFHQILQCAVPQFAKFAVQEMCAHEKKQDGIGAVLHFAASLLQSCIFAE